MDAAASRLEFGKYRFIAVLEALRHPKSVLSKLPDDRALHIPFSRRASSRHASSRHVSRSRSGGLRKDVLVLAIADDQYTLAGTVTHHEFEAVGAGIDGEE